MPASGTFCNVGRSWMVRATAVPVLKVQLARDTGFPIFGKKSACRAHLAIKPRFAAARYTTAHAGHCEWAATRTIPGAARIHFTKTKGAGQRRHPNRPTALSKGHRN